MLKMRYLLLALMMTLALAGSSFATRQASDCFVYKNLFWKFFSASDKSGDQPYLLEGFKYVRLFRSARGCTGCDRGYIAFWLIGEDKKLMLKGVDACRTNNSATDEGGTSKTKPFNIKDAWPGKYPEGILADWFTGTISLVQKNHSTNVTILHFEKGRLIREEHAFREKYVFSEEYRKRNPINPKHGVVSAVSRFLYWGSHTEWYDPWPFVKSPAGQQLASLVRQNKLSFFSFSPDNWTWESDWESYNFSSCGNKATVTWCLLLHSEKLRKPVAVFHLEKKEGNWRIANVSIVPAKDSFKGEGQAKDCSEESL